jgi:hypothetical protein
MKALLDLFEEKVPDKESNRLVWRFCDEKENGLKHMAFTQQYETET